MKKRTNRPHILSLVALLIIATFICTLLTAYAVGYKASHMTFAFPQELNQYLRTDIGDAGIKFFPNGSGDAVQLSKNDGETLIYNGKVYDVYSLGSELTPTSDTAQFRTYLKVGTNKTAKIKNSNPDYWPTSAENMIAVPDSIDDLKSGSQNATFTWVKYTKITLDANGGTAGSKASFSIVKDKDMPALTSTGELPTKQGCTFNGFFDAATDGTKYYNADGTSAKKWDKTSANTTLYAQWTTNPTVTFDMQGYGTQVDPQTVAMGEKVEKPDNPTAEGYAFGGWYKEADCTNAWDFNTDTVSADTTIFAKWTPLYCAFIDLNNNGEFDEGTETRYETLNAAFAAINSQSGNNVTLMILSNIEEALTDNYTFTKNVTITSSSPVTVDLKNSDNEKYLIPGNGTTLTIGENITLKNVYSIGADETSGSLVVDGTVTANYIRAFGPKNSESKAHLVINGKVEGASTEAAIRISQNSNVTINGSIETQKDVTTVNASDFQIKNLYPADKNSISCDFKLNNAAINYTQGFDQSSSVIDYELNHSYIKVSGDTTPKFYLNNASTMNLKAASVLEVGDMLTIDSDAKLSISGNSTITAKDLTNNGTIIVDMTGATAARIKLIDCSGSGSYGTASTNYKFVAGKDNGYTLTVDDNDLYAVCKAASIIGGTEYDTVQAAVTAATTGQTVKMLADSTETGEITISAGVTLNTDGYTLTNKGTLNWNLISGLESYGSMVNFQNYINNGGTQRILVTENQPHGDYVIASGDFSDVMGKDTFTLSVIEQATASICVGGNSIFYCGNVYRLTINNNDTPDNQTDDLLVLTVSEPDYLAFTAGSAFNMALTKNGNAPAISLQYSTDKTNWTDWTDVTNAVSAGESGGKYVIYLRNGKTEGEYTTNTTFASDDSKYYSFAFTDTSGGAAPAIAASGNIMTLLDYTKPNAGMTSANNWAFFKLFSGCSSLTTAPELPATTLANNCYQYMFRNCKSLTTAPELPATTLAEKCYYSMFSGCSSLTAAPALPATTLADACYYSMFYGCTSLTAAPALPATTLADACYSQMFYGCSSLTAAPALPATTLADACYYNMFNGCTALTAAPALPTTTLTKRCYKEMFKGCTALLVKAGTAEDYTWKILASNAEEPVIDMATNTAAGSVTVEVPQTGYNYYKVIGLTGSDGAAVADDDAAANAKTAIDNMNAAINTERSFNGTGTGAAGSSSISDVLGTNGYVKVVLTGVGMNNTGAAAGSDSKVITYTFDVTPVHATNGAMHGNIGSDITFRLPILATDAAKYKSVLLSHDGESMGTAPIECQGTTAFVSVTSSKYSEFSYTLTKTSNGGKTTTTYAVSTSEAKNGSVEISSKSASAGRTVTVTVKPDKGYTLETLTVLDKNGKEIELTAKKIGETYTFKMPSSTVTVKATFMEDNYMLNFFVDVKVSDYFYDAVMWATKSGITSGTDNLHFAPNAITTRSQMVTFLWRAAGCPEPTTTTCPFTDLKADEFYYKAVLWAVEKGLTKGVSATEFAPDVTVDRAQSVTFLARYEGVKDDATGYTHSFSDVATSDYYNNAVAWAATNKVTEGTSATTFAPNDSCLRGQIVTFIYRNFSK